MGIFKRLHLTDRIRKILTSQERLKKNDLIDSQLLYYIDENTKIFTFDDSLLNYLNLLNPGYKEEFVEIKNKVFPKSNS